MTKSTIYQKIIDNRREKEAFYQKNEHVLQEWHRLCNVESAILQEAKERVLKASSILGTDEFDEPIEVSFQDHGIFVIRNLEYNEDSDQFELTYQGQWSEAELQVIFFDEEALYPELVP